MYNHLTEVTADCTDVLSVKPQKIMPNPGRKNQIVHEFEDFKQAVVAVSNTSLFEVELQWTYVSAEDRSTIFELFHDATKANGSARSFYWLNPVDGYVYTVRFLTPLRTVFKPGILRSIETIRLRVEGYLTDTEYEIDLGDIHLATVNGGAMFFHDTEDFSVYAGASGNTPFKIVFTDDTGLTAEAWCGEQGSGETLGDELVTNGDFSGTWSGEAPDGWTIVGAVDGSNYIEKDDINNRVRVVAVGGYVGIRQDNVAPVPQGKLYKQILDIHETLNGSLQVGLGGINNEISTTSTQYYTGLVDNRIFLQRNTGGCNVSVNGVSLMLVTTSSTSGLKLYSTQNGTTQSMGTTEAGFDPNAITKVDIYG